MDEIKILEISNNMVSEAASFFQKRLADTFSRTFPSEAVNKYSDDFMLENLAQHIKADDRVNIAALIQNDIVGIMFGSHINGGVASVIWIAVHPDIKGRGIGRILMEETFRKYNALGAHKLVLYTETEDAKIFYEKIGMTVEGIHPKHWWGIKHYCLAMELQTGQEQEK